MNDPGHDAPSGEGYYAARHNDCLYIRVVGMANMANALHLDAFIKAETDQGVRQVCVDLSDCHGMDSTFMGILVGVHNHLRKEGGGRLVVLNPSKHNRRLLDMLGLSSVMPVIHRQRLPDLRFVAIGRLGTQTHIKRIRRVKKAHEDLVAISPRNREQFRTFLEALARELGDEELGDEELAGDG